MSKYPFFINYDPNINLKFLNPKQVQNVLSFRTEDMAFVKEREISLMLPRMKIRDFSSTWAESK